VSHPRISAKIIHNQPGISATPPPDNIKTIQNAIRRLARFLEYLSEMDISRPTEKCHQAEIQRFNLKAVKVNSVDSR